MSAAFSKTLVLLQMALLVILAATTPLRAAPVSIFVMTSGGLLGIWALIVMRLRRLRIMPEVHPDAVLVMRGPYRRVRHPMYTAVLVFAAGMVSMHPTPERIALFLFLAVVMIAKLLREERFLMAAFPEYAAYQKTTKRLVPFFW
ncbi:MAG TPA: methyltransferase [Kiritimatiellia bacterium]|nr:methyltransferase [Kiritimatiellia bacterium]HMO99873.1 methyltransferase [Kiritimatiellia bacterium]HMP96744.1 methyltransferase [Kiritimatiellia bacterium]